MHTKMYTHTHTHTRHINHIKLTAFVSCTSARRAFSRFLGSVTCVSRSTYAKTRTRAEQLWLNRAGIFVDQLKQSKLTIYAVCGRHDIDIHTERR